MEHFTAVENQEKLHGEYVDMQIAHYLDLDLDYINISVQFMQAIQGQAEAY